MTLAQDLLDLLNVHDNAVKFPFGPALPVEHRKMVGDACVHLCGGDADKGRTLWKRIVEHHGGYFPEAAGNALILSTPAATVNLVPDVTAPEPT